jgi:hypothetical protein
MSPVDPAQAVKLARIRMALRRATGQAFDVEALLLGSAAQATASIKAWRALGSADLNTLLDHWVNGAAPAPAPAPAPAQESAPATPTPPTDPDAPKPPTNRRYLRGAR